MNNQLTTFEFEGANVQVIKDENNEPWFLAKDICAILGYANVSQTINDNCVAKGISKRYTPTSGGNQELTYINEGNLYRLVIKSNKPEAERFESWVCDEVLPSIRKTGSYSTSKRKTQSTSFSQPIAREMRGMLSLAKLCGLKGNQAILHADEATQKVTGQSPIKLLGIELASPAQEIYYTPTQLGEQLGMSARKFNDLLKEKGFQVNVSGKWTATEKGKPFSEVKDVNKKNTHGTTQHLQWYASIKHELVSGGAATGVSNHA